MTRVLFVTQEKGGVGKSLVARALAEALPKAPIIEVDSTQRLIELEKRTHFFPMRAEFSEIEKSGGKAARAEFDAVSDAILASEVPTIIDVGANTSRALLATLAASKPILDAAMIEPGVLVVVTSEPGALAEAPRLLALAGPFATCFILENRFRGQVKPEYLGMFAGNHPISVLEEHVMEDDAVQILQGGGLASIPKLDLATLGKTYGMTKAARIQRDLTRLRFSAMQAVRGPAEWLLGGK